MHFCRVGEIITFQVLLWPDSGRKSFQQNKVFSTSGNYAEIYLPFWRALRGLQGRFSVAELEERWHNPFPQRELNALTALLGKDLTSQATQ